MTRFESRSADWLSVEDARARVLERAAPLPEAEVSLDEALGRALAAPVEATATLPPWDNSAMDGYAVRAADVRGASDAAPVRLAVAAEIRAGDRVPEELPPGQAMRIMTGAPVPPGADSVIRVEHTDAENAPGTVCVRSDADAGRNVRPAGEDMRPGQRILDAGITVGPGQVGVLSALGVQRVRVRRRPRVALLACGDELAPIARFEDVRAGRAVPDSNSHAVAAAVLEVAGDSIRLGIAGDTEDSVKSHLVTALASDADALLTLAGASMGETDLFKRVLDRLGFELDFWRVRLRPGSPFSFGLLPRPDGAAALPVFGLPGNPASAFVTFHVFARPFLLALAGHSRIHPPVVPATLGAALRTPHHLAQFVRVRLDGSGREIRATPTGPQGSGMVRSLGVADGLAVVPEGVGSLGAGDAVDVMLLGGGRGWSTDAGFVASPR